MANTGDGLSDLKKAAEGAAQRLRGATSSTDLDLLAMLRRYRAEHTQCRTNTWAADAGGASISRDNRCALCKEADEKI